MAGPDDVSLFSPSAGKRVWQATLATERGLTGNSGLDILTEPERFTFRNDSGEVIPPYSILQMTGMVQDGGRNFITVDKPINWTGAVVGPFLFSGSREIAIGGFGQCQNGPVYRVIKDSTTLTVGMRIGPVNNQWTVGKGCLYSYIGPDDVATDCIRVISNETPILAVTGGGGISGNSSGTVTVRVPSSTIWSTGSVTYTAHNPTSTSIGGSKNVILFPVDTKWVALEIC